MYADCRMRRALPALLICLGFTPAASAQVPRKLPVAALDLRGFYSGLGQDPVTAKALLLPADNLPKRGLGATAGLQLYPLRWQNVALGIGAEAMLAHGQAQ